ncbi:MULTISPECIES: MurR/RpiR family transcriptional regulator [unclassified Brenneria]|uniref:MurR/RpiR family transcriptional regulator n=1 Tax=unclassified Brenneria TaxID=2634434 RepID=UPI0029C3B901|nr:MULTISPECIES: MurR/RpiR family transcriptional regulator [unclassified Brenneria]MDX5630406.1 MurR/RpiR family transcriptional regulator [Brenneria sp. L3-3Z]MDX5697551.1 MurR/RpiR family transcriptional regulator [Brenneria sp. L4-2C]MEE3662466.1 MurR/RpiR family transcriptional regulator [Brenneria sp. g21c3]
MSSYSDNHSAEAIGELQDLIRQIHPMLSPAEKKFVTVLLRYQHNLASYSATELAKQAGVSKSTAARCFRHLGFTDFNHFRRTFRPAMVTGKSPLTHLENTAPGAADTYERLAAHVETDKKNIDNALDSVFADNLTQAVELLGGARRIWITGFRNSYISAYYALSIFSNICPDVRLVNDSAGRFVDNLADLHADDVMLVVDFPRRVNMLDKIVNVAKSRNIKMICLCDRLISSLNAQVDVVLACHTASRTIFDSYTVGISMINFLAGELALQHPQKAKERMQEIERIHQMTGDLFINNDEQV